MSSTLLCCLLLFVGTFVLHPATLVLYRCPHVFRGTRHCSCVLPTSYKQQWSYTGSGTWSIQKGSGVHLPPYNVVVDMRQCKRQPNWCLASSLGHFLSPSSPCRPRGKCTVPQPITLQSPVAHCPAAHHPATHHIAACPLALQSPATHP